MKRVMLTGATGFLGKRVLNLLIEDPKVETIHIVSRKSRTHPSAKVQAHQGDLILPWSNAKLDLAPSDIDTVIHLAGLYDFSAEYGENYRQNVLPTLNLLDWLKEGKASPSLIFSSTYAVGAGLTGTLGEDPITELPSAARAYAHTKAIAERALTDSSLPVRIFRMGVLVGDTSTGEFEKIDGPYALMELLARISGMPFKRLLRSIPIPALPEGVLPVVPVDAAARAIHQSLHMAASDKPEIYGLYNPRSVKIGDLTHAIFAELLPGSKPSFVSSREAGGRLLSLQQFFTGTPKELYRFALEPVELECANFQRVFGKKAVPHFDEFREPFFKGFRSLLKGGAV